MKPTYRPHDFAMYQSANAKFAAAAASEAAGTSALVLVQDYHLALAPRTIRRRLASSTIVAFWHIPWPAARVFKTCPWSAELLDGLLGSDIVGLQTRDDCVNFFDSVEMLPGADVDRRRGTVKYRGQTTLVRAYPVGIEWNNHVVRHTPSVSVCRERVYRDLELSAHMHLAVGIDRLDYTKGIHEKFLAVERLFEQHPTLRGRFVLVQVAEPSRECLPAYRATHAQIADTSARINARFGAGAYRPIRLLDAHREPSEVYQLLRAAGVCYVGSLHDGMNLVAKEFVCAREDGRGVLLLSEFAGAAQQLRAAVTINPYATDDCAHALWRALTMTDAEQFRRMSILRENVATFDSRWWAQRILTDAQSLRHGGFGAPISQQVVATRASA
jgi:trehalose 6-phosphate synthase